MHNSKVEQLGLADLGNVLKAPDGKAYVQVLSHHLIEKSHQITHTLSVPMQDGDNNLDICLDLTEMSQALQVHKNIKLFTTN